jgi:hypothetical protein
LKINSRGAIIFRLLLKAAHAPVKEGKKVLFIMTLGKKGEMQGVKELFRKEDPSKGCGSPIQWCCPSS